MNLLKTITSPAPVLTGYWTLVSQDTTLLHGIWIALPNHRTILLQKSQIQTTILLKNLLNFLSLLSLAVVVLGVVFD